MIRALAPFLWLLWFPVAVFVIGGFAWLMTKPQRDLIKYISENRGIVRAEDGVITTQDGRRWHVDEDK